MSRNSRRAVPVCYTQNFLTSRKTINRLLRLTDIGKTDTVVEIGAGKGHITKALLEICGKVVATEIDAGLCASLRGKLAGTANLTLSNRDFLKSPLPLGEYKVFANIPFGITTDIVKKLTQSNNPPLDAWLIMEKGAAKRFCGKPWESLQSLLLKPFFDTRIVYYFRREDFHPAPGVDVVMLHIAHKTQPEILPQHKEAYRDFISHALRHGLSGKQALLTKRQISTALGLAGLQPIEQSDEVLYVQWLCLFRCWLEYGRRM